MIYDSIQELKLHVNDVVYENHAGYITGPVMQELLHDFLDTIDNLYVASQWSLDGVNIYYNAGQVYIGQATGAYMLDVNGDINITTGNHYKINGVNLEYGDVGAAAASHSHMVTDILDFPNLVSYFTNDAGYLDTETDPVFVASPAAGILAGDITNWNTAYGWGDHSLEGYLTVADVEDGTAAGQVLFWTGSKWAHTETSEVFWDDTNKFIGIGINTPKSIMHLYKGNSGQSTPDASGMLIIEDDSVNGINFLVPSASSTYIIFGDNNDADAGYIVYNHSGDYIGFHTGNSTERVRINASGFQIKDGYSLYFGFGAEAKITASGAAGNVEMQFLMWNGADYVEAMRITDDCKVAIGLTVPNQLLTVENSMSLKEIAAANADTASYGQIWVKNTTPNELWFTDDAGTDYQVSHAHPYLPLAGGTLTGNLLIDKAAPILTLDDLGEGDYCAIYLQHGADKWSIISDDVYTPNSLIISHTGGANLRIKEAGAMSIAINPELSLLGAYSFTGGKGYAAASKEIVASGQTSFNFSENTTNQTDGHGALANYSAILGGVDHNIESDSTHAVIIGGSLNKIDGGQYGGIFGGSENVIDQTSTGDVDWSIIVGGNANVIQAQNTGYLRNCAIVGGGTNHIYNGGASNIFSNLILGGDGNSITNLGYTAIVAGNSITADQAFTTYVESLCIQADQALYIGMPLTDGSYRLIISGDNLLIQQRESGSYVTKQTISGA